VERVPAHARFAAPEAIRDANVLMYIDRTVAGIRYSNLASQVIDDFLENYYQWIAATSFIQGLERFVVKRFSQGTTETFDKFYFKHRARKIRFFDGEYAYHRINLRHTGSCAAISAEEPLREGDALILSIPFADTLDLYAGHYRNLKQLFTECDRLSIPVLLDLVFLGTLRQLSVDASFGCIDAMTFSLSKTFPVGNCRIGMRLSRDDYDDGLNFYHVERYNSLISATIGLALVRQFDAFYMVENYHSEHLAICQSLNLEPSGSILFGFGGDEYKAYRRANLCNRVFVGREYRRTRG